MTTGSTLTDSQPPPKPPAIPGRIPQAPPDDAGDSSLDQSVESLKQEVASILKNTKWPEDSTAAAGGLLDTIDLSPNISSNVEGATPELLTLVEQYIRVLDDVRIRLKDASSKSEMKRWKFLERIKSLTSNRPSKCTLLFQTCQDDIATVINALNDRLACERVGDSLESPSQAQHRSLALDPATGTSQQGTTVDDSAPKSLPPGQVQSHNPKDRKNQGPISDSALNVARKTFKSVEIGSGAIPVVGSYVGAAAKVGLAFVEMLQTMDRNNSLAIDLGDHTANLTKLLKNIKERSNGDEHDIISQIKDLHQELGQVGDRVEEWNSLGRFSKAFSAREHAETLKEYQGLIQKAREEIQLLVNLDSRNIIVELENMELRKERDRLLECLGDGQYGARGNMIEDIICFPGTRQEILEKVGNWIRDTSPASRVLWICGMAGRGKSTIASTVVHNWRCRASCALFHFRRGQSALNSRVICALARQLGDSLVPEVKNAILESVRQNKGIGELGRRFDEQFENLFVAPFENLKTHSHPILIVVDALDECDNPKDAVDFVELIHKHSPSFPTNVKFLLTCRPEDPIRRHLEYNKWDKEDLDTAPDVNNDLARFLQHACAHIRKHHELGEDWPSSREIEQLVQMSQGLFQWARTVVTYIGHGSPIDRMRALLRCPSTWRGLDDLYHQILSKAFDGMRLDPVREDILLRVLGTLVVAPYPVSLEILATLYGQHEIFEEAGTDRIIPFLRKDILADLNSLLFIPESPTESMRLMHTSIHDLLSSELRCKQQPFFVRSARCHQQLAGECFRIMLESLKENIGNLSDLSKSSLDDRSIVEQEVSMSVQYCCRAWPTHLTQGVERWKSGGSVIKAGLDYLETFSNGKIMHWLEVMSLMGATTEAIMSARRVQQWLLQPSRETPDCDRLAGLWDDVQRFITAFWEPISFGPLHIYFSALPHCPTETELWRLYGKYAKVRVLHNHQMSRWQSNLWTRSVGAAVNSVAFSPDGRVLAFGSDDNTVRLLDTQTGAVVGEPLTGHSDAVWSVCFSPDGKLLASGSADRTIQLWDPETRTAVGEPLIGHNGEINSVCFLPDGTALASGSDDQTVRIWDTKTGMAKGEALTSHRNVVWWVSFSSNGKLLASGSEDHTIRLWDPQTQIALGEPLIGHDDRVMSICFSPDGELLASGSRDQTIRLWDPATRKAVGEPLISHSDEFRSVCFSPGGKVLASGSFHGTIRLWDAQTRTAMGKALTGHSGIVRSICFTSDGKLLASGSVDKTIRLWDPQAGAAVAGSLISHSATVTSVCFSPNGKRVASAYDDGSIRLWGPQTGAAVGEPLIGHTRPVNSVCFSPDGKLLASGSNDNTIRLWDAQAGVAAGEPLRGHGDWIRSLSFSPDGRYLASGSDDGTVRLWDPHTGLAVASGSWNGTIRLCDPQTGMAAGEPIEGTPGYGISVSFSSDGTLLLARYGDGSLATWDVTTRQRCDTPHNLLFYANLYFGDHWIKFGSSRSLWLPPQYWNSRPQGVALLDGQLAAIQNGTLSILDVSRVLETLTNQS